MIQKEMTIKTLSQSKYYQIRNKTSWLMRIFDMMHIYDKADQELPGSTARAKIRESALLHFVVET
jgi:hypothetical protein